MKNAVSLDQMTLRELGAIASAARVPRWSRLKKAELLVKLVALGSAVPSLDEAIRVRDAKRAAASGTFENQTETPQTTPIAATTKKNSENTAKKKKGSSAARASKSETKKNGTAQFGAKSDAQTGSASTSEPGSRPTSPRVSNLKEKMRRLKELGRETDRADRLLLTVCDPYWLRACWEITPRLVGRVRSAMGRHWHTADPALRVFKIFKEPQGSTRRELVADVPIRGGVDNWYLDVDDPPSSFMVELGYLARDKEFFTLISSNVVETPQRSVVDAFGRPTDGFGATTTDLGAISPRVFSGAAFGRPSASFSLDGADPLEMKFGDALERNYRSPNDAFSARRRFRVEVDAEIVVKGTAAPGVQIRVKEEPIRVDANGAFSIRYRLPERRHVFPVVATSVDGAETQTIILAVDRNTKVLEPVFKEEADE